MENNQMFRVTMGQTTRDYPAGTTFQTIADQVQGDYPHDVLLVNRNGKLCELHKKLDRDCALTMVTAADRPGMQTYERTALLLLLKAFYDTVGRDKIRRVRVEYSLSHALFLRAMGDFTLDKDLLERVEARMRALAAEKMPIVKQSMSTDDGVERLRAMGMEDKARLLSYRISSRVNLYTMGDFTDYFYGYMAPNAFVLRLPSQSDPEHLGEFKPSMKVFRAMNDMARRTATMHIDNVGEINDMISAGLSTQLILGQEALMEKQIGDIAQEIADRPDVRFVMIAGPSSSGKTTFSHRLSTQLMACGLTPHPIATDNYFKNRVLAPRDADGQYDFECLEAMDVEFFNTDMGRLLRGETIDLPTYNFKKGEREYNGEQLTLGEHDVLVIEGIHCLNDRFASALPRESMFKIYISCLTTLNVDDHNRIHTTAARLLRRIERDARTRGYSAQATIRMWPSVRRGEERNIFPYQDSADAVFNSALIYETALLKTYVEPLLFSVPRDSREYVEAKRLLKFLSYSLPIPADDVPKTSLVRAFIGGGCYQV